MSPGVCRGWWAETVSTDYDTSDKLYFEPVTVEDVLQIYEAEKPMGVIVQFGGQTPLNIARQLQEAGCKILGTSVDSIDDAEDRDLFHATMDKLGIPMPESMMASDIDGALKCAAKLGYPLIIRPSFVLGGRGMEVIFDEIMLREYVDKAVGVTPDRPLYLDRFLCHAMECEADALSDGKDIFIPAIMQHIELAGIHSGDSACVLPPVTIPEDAKATILDYTRRIAAELKVVGLMNMQFAIEDGKVYVIEANPRASRTVPLVSKVGGVQMAGIATQLMLGDTVKSLGLDKRHVVPYFGVKEAVLPFEKFPEVDPVLGPPCSAATGPPSPGALGCAGPCQEPPRLPCAPVMTHRRQPTRPRHPWDSPGKNTEVGCHFLLQCTKVKSESEDGMHTL